MNLFSPEPILHSTMMAIMSKGMNIEVYDSVLELKIPKQIVVTYFNEFKNNADGRASVEISSDQLTRGITADEVESFYRLQSLIGICISNAETINRRMSSLLTNIRRIEGKTEDFSQLDFMVLRDEISKILKRKKKIEEIYELSTSGKTKSFTKACFRYITDRNIYTHGELSLNILKNQFIIYAHVDGRKSYYKVDRDILTSHINFFKYIHNTLGELDIYFTQRHL